MGSENSIGIVYVLTNPAMPGLTKIGKTSQEEISLRLKQLYTTGVPVPFECYFACQVKDFEKVEEAFHFAFDDLRVNPKREFFRIEPEKVKTVLQLLSIQDVTPQVESEITEDLDDVDKESGENLKRRRPPMNFNEMNIPVGAILNYRKGNVQVTVADEKHVKYENEVCSLTAVTKGLLGSEYNVQPAPHWSYDGKSLKEIYDETYSDED
jgi:hypothetical protein